MSLDNEIERIHAIKLIRQIIKTGPLKFPKSLVFALVAIGNDGASERDRMVRVSLETICELGIFTILIFNYKFVCLSNLSCILIYFTNKHNAELQLVDLGTKDMG